MKTQATFLALIFSFNYNLFVNAEFAKSWFESHLFYRLKVESLRSKSVKSPTDCGLACLQNILCLSFNVALNADEKGQFRCELLRSNRYLEEERLAADQHFNHYGLLMENPCSRASCQNNGACVTVSFRLGTYQCNCHPGYAGHHCEIAPQECSQYNVLSEPDRHVSFGRGNKTDQNLPQGWYRFQSSSYTRMAAKLTKDCIPFHKCGTDHTGFLEGEHPSQADGIVTRQACFHAFYRCCFEKVQIGIRRCDGFYVYKLQSSPSGLYRYCAE
ncbi:uromodulin-like [Montipora foliosa]|uniref:uromodulin-like n=1 Tax=Montipora foliosa TaxID=591990 RepID=UPI0035F1A01C